MTTSNLTSPSPRVLSPSISPKCDQIPGALPLSREASPAHSEKDTSATTSPKIFGAQSLSPPGLPQRSRSADDGGRPLGRGYHLVKTHGSVTSKKLQDSVEISFAPPPISYAAIPEDRQFKEKHPPKNTLLTQFARRYSACNSDSVAPNTVFVKSLRTRSRSPTSLQVGKNPFTTKNRVSVEYVGKPFGNSTKDILNNDASVDPVPIGGKHFTDDDDDESTCCSVKTKNVELNTGDAAPKTIKRKGTGFVTIAEARAADESKAKGLRTVKNVLRQNPFTQSVKFVGQLIMNTSKRSSSSKAKPAVEIKVRSLSLDSSCHDATGSVVATSGA